MPRLPLPKLPLAAAIPAAAASLAYLNAKYTVSADVFGIYSAIGLGLYSSKIEKQDRVNTFYRFEEVAQDPKTAKTVFLVVPKDGLPPGSRTEWTYGEAYLIVLKYAKWLKEVHGVQKSEVVAMDFKNNPKFIWMWFALWSLGAIPAFINSNLEDKAFIHCVKVSTSRLLLLDSELGHLVTEEARGQFGPDENDKGRAVETVLVSPDLELQIEAGLPFRAPDDARSGVVRTSNAMLIYTSGTTGLPKAANVAWSKPISGVYLFPKILGLTPKDRYLTAMPLYHSSGSILGVLQAVGASCTMVILPKFSPRLQMKQAVETGATVMQYIGEMCRYLVTSPPTPYDQTHSLRLAFGNGMRPDVWQKFKDRFNIPDILEFYGATESPAASMVYSKNDFYRGAIGRGGLLMRTLFGGNQALIKHDHETDEPYRDPRTNFCQRAATDEPGELIYRLDPENIREKYQGYLGNEKASDSKILTNVFKRGDAYYRSGDLQRRDADGRWWFMDRIGDTFRWKGENVSTAEVSEALGSHPSLLEANVYGVALPNHDGRAGCAAIGLPAGKTLDENLGAELATHARKRLPKYAVPLFLRQMQEIEVTGTLKHQKVALRNEGVDPSKTGDGDELYWLPPGAERYTKFGKAEWEKLVGGAAKL